MFRISHYLRDLATAERSGSYPALPARRGAVLPGPVVIWNLIRRCNLTCKHCYALSADHEYSGDAQRETDWNMVIMRNEHFTADKNQNRG